jgi:hypothetical protein
MAEEQSSGALALQEAGRNLQEAGPSQAKQMLAMIQDAATNPEVDAQKMVTLADLAIKLQDRERETEFRRAKVAALFETAQLRISKRGAILNKNGGVQSRYSKFEDIHRVVTPIFASHQLAVSFKVGQAGSLVTVRPVLTHANGYQEEGDAMPLAIDTTGSKNATQGAGSAASYGKRHTLKALANIIEEGEDDDGQATGPGGLKLSPQEQRLAESAERQAKAGVDNYAAWFQALSPAERGWLVYSGRHDQMKQLAGEPSHG